MKSVYLLAKTPSFFDVFNRYLTGLGYDYDEADNSVKLKFDGGLYFMFYDRIEGCFFEKHEIPSEAHAQGFRFAFLVECRSEELVCDIVGSFPDRSTLLICDSNEALFTPEELSPEKLML